MLIWERGLATTGEVQTKQHLPWLGECGRPHRHQVWTDYNGCDVWRKVSAKKPADVQLQRFCWLQEENAAAAVAATSLALCTSTAAERAISRPNAKNWRDYDWLHLSLLLQQQTRRARARATRTWPPWLVTSLWRRLHAQRPSYRQTFDRHKRKKPALEATTKECPIFIEPMVDRRERVGAGMKKVNQLNSLCHIQKKWVFLCFFLFCCLFVVCTFSWLAVLTRKNELQLSTGKRTWATCVSWVLIAHTPVLCSRRPLSSRIHMLVELQNHNDA